MSQVIYSASAIRDLERLRDFLREKNPMAASQAAKSIIDSIQMLSSSPQIGIPVENLPQDFRDWLIKFGRSGYVARYRISDNGVVILAIRHQKEGSWTQ